jgi:endoglucanase
VTVKHLLSAALACVLAATAVLGGTTAADAASIRSASASSIFAGGLYVQPDSAAAIAAGSLHGAEKRAAKYIAKRSVAVWLGDWATGRTLVSYIERNLAAAKKQKKTAVFVTYAIPNRDCGGHSAGGLSAAGYSRWTKLVAKTLKGERAVVLVEPDSLSTLDICPAGTSEQRIPLLRTAAKAFSKAHVPSYLDGGTSSQLLNPDVMAQRLKSAGISSARGFFTNVANYRTTAEEKGWAASLSPKVGNAHYVIDVSRNGRGYAGEWCNAPGAGLGADPRVVKHDKRLDALLWVKTPGASDGTCNGGPAAGAWFPSYAQSLVAARAR